MNPSEAERDGVAPLLVLVQASTGMRGPQRSIVEFAVWLSERHEVLFAAPRGWVINSAKARAPRLRTLTLPGGRSADRVASARILASVTRKRRVIFHANGLSALNLVAPGAIAGRAQVLVHFHAYELPRRQRAVAVGWTRSGVRARFHAVSDFSTGLLEATALRPAVGGVLPNPFRVPAVSTDRESHHALRIGFVGGADPRKGLRRFIEVASLCADLDVEWWIYGIASHHHDAYLAASRAAADRLGVADRLRWMGAVADPDSVYGSLDAVLIASSLESFCRVGVEAMMAGLPVIGTRIPGLSEVVWDGVTGLLFDPQDPGEGAAQVRRLVADPGYRAQLGAAGRSAGLRFDIEAVGPRLERLYRTMWEPRGPTLSPQPTMTQGVVSP